MTNFYVVRRGGLYFAQVDARGRQWWTDDRRMAARLTMRRAQRIVDKTEGLIAGQHEIEDA